jgi:hypothetical protein
MKYREGKGNRFFIILYTLLQDVFANKETKSYTMKMTYKRTLFFVDQSIMFVFNISQKKQKTNLTSVQMICHFYLMIVNLDFVR